MSEAGRKKHNANLMNTNEEEEEDEEAERAAQEQHQTAQIMQTGAITATKGKYVIHCLTIVGQVVTKDNERGLSSSGYT